MTTSARYTGAAIGLHWAGAALIFAGFGLGLFMTGLPLSPAKLRYYAWHKWIGITVFLVAATRLAWRVAMPPPRLPAAMPGTTALFNCAKMTPGEVPLVGLTRSQFPPEVVVATAEN